MVNHLYGGNNAARHRQASMLNQRRWEQDTPVIAIGDTRSADSPLFRLDLAGVWRVVEHDLRALRAAVEALLMTCDI
jgi:hypothetical protein